MHELSLEAQLVVLLEKHIDANRRLLRVVKEERELIIHNKLEELEGINQAKLASKEEISLVEKERVPLMQRFIDEYNLNRSQLKLDQLIPLVASNYREKLRTQKRALQRLVASIQSTQECNRIIIKKSLSFHERSFNVLFGLVKEHMGYAASGEIKHNQKRLVDSIV